MLLIDSKLPSYRHTRMAWHRTPNETWQMIFRYAISVPVFFDGDPIEIWVLEEYARYYRSEKSYWDAERYRSALRCVCSDWNAYLKRFDNRYVRLRDVSTGDVAISAITTVIRLRSDPHISGYPTEEHLLREAVGMEKQEWSLEIMDVPVYEIRKILLESGKISRLRSIAYIEDTDPQEISPFPLQFCSINGLSVEIPQAPFRFSHLTTLSILPDTVKPFPEYQMPALKHFSILLAAYDDEILEPNDLIKLLRVIGRNLVTFFDRSPLSEYVIPDETWNLCPSLERLQTGLQWPTRFSTPLPISFKKLHLPSEIIKRYHRVYSKHFAAAMLHQSGIDLVQLPGSWKVILGNYKRTSDLIIHAMEHEITVEDMSGQSFQNFVIRAWLNRKSRDRDFVRDWDVYYHAF